MLPFDSARLRDSGIAEASRIIRETPAPAPVTRLAEAGTASAVSRVRRTDVEGLRRTLTGDLGRMIAVCLEKDPQFRYSSAAALAEDIDRYLRGEPVLARGPGIAYRVRRKLRRYRGALPAAGVALGVTAACAALLWTMLRPSRAPLNFVPLTTYQGSETSPTFSPDGDEVAFAWNGEREDNWDIYRLRIGDATPRRLTSNPAVEYSPAWSRDGKTIAFLRAAGANQADVMLMPAAGGEARILSRVIKNVDPRKRALVWSPDSRRLLIGHSKPGTHRQHIIAITAATGEQRDLTGQGNTTSISDGQPAFSRDGMTLYFARDAGTPGQIWMLPLTRELRAAGPEQRIHIPGFDGQDCGAPIPIHAREFLFTGPTRGSSELLRGSVAGKGSTAEPVGAGRACL